MLIVPAFIHCRNVTKWKIWAFEEVRNVHELRRRALNEGIIIPFLERFIPLSREEQIQIERISVKFQQPDLYPQDAGMPDVVEVFYNKKYNLLEATLYFLATCLALAWAFIWVIAGETDLLLPILPALFFALCIYNLLQYRNVKPRVVFRHDGIRVKSTFVHKSKIDDVVVSLNRKIPQLAVSEKGSLIDVVIGINSLDIHLQKLHEIATVFKRRWQIEKSEGAQTGKRDDQEGRYLR